MSFVSDVKTKVKQHVAETIAIGLALFVLISAIANKTYAIPVGIFGGAFWSLYRAYLSSKSNSTTQEGSGGPGVTVIDNTGNVPLVQTAQFKFFAALFVIGIIVVFMLAAEK